MQEMRRISVGGNGRKEQSALEYMLSYGWALIVIAVVVSAVYYFVLLPSILVPSQCNVASGLHCDDIVVGSNSISGKSVLLLTNNQKYAILDPSVTISINGQNTTANCLTKYASSGGSIVCLVDLADTPVQGQLVAGSFQVNAQYCGLSSNPLNASSCSTVPKQVYSGTFSAHSSGLFNPSINIMLSAYPNPGYEGTASRVTAQVTLLGYPVKGATINFTSNSIAIPISPEFATSDAHGNATTYLHPSSTGSSLVRASYSNVVSSIIVQFLTPTTSTTTTISTTTSTTTTISTTTSTSTTSITTITSTTSTSTTSTSTTSTSTTSTVPQVYITGTLTPSPGAIVLGQSSTLTASWTCQTGNCVLPYTEQDYALSSSSSSCNPSSWIGYTFSSTSPSSLSYTPSGVGTYYICASITDSGGNFGYTSVGALSVITTTTTTTTSTTTTTISQVSVGLSPQSTYYMDVGQSVQFTASASGGTGSYSYTWSISSGLLNSGGANSCASTSNYCYVTASSTGSQSVSVYATSSGVSSPTASTSLSVSPSLSASISASPSTIILGQSTSVTVSWSGGTSRSGYIIYAYRSTSTCNSGSTSVYNTGTGSSPVTFSDAPPSTGTYYYCGTVQDSASVPMTASTPSVSVSVTTTTTTTSTTSTTTTSTTTSTTTTTVPAFLCSVSPLSRTMDSGQSYTLSGSCTGGTPPYSNYDWYSGSSCTSDLAIPSTSYQFTAPSVSSPTSYYYFCFYGTDSAGHASKSSAATMAVNPALSVPVVSQGTGSPPPLKVSWSGGSMAYYITWYSYTASVTFPGQMSCSTVYSSGSQYWSDSVGSSPESVSITLNGLPPSGQYSFFCAKVRDAASAPVTQPSTTCLYIDSDGIEGSCGS